jgi:hypothetical protein
MFGSGAMHAPYALFINQSKQFNGGRKVGLIRAAGTRMAGHSYAQLRMLRLRGPLLATINSAAYINLKLKGVSKMVEAFLGNADMWEATFSLQRCLFPMIRVLRLGDMAACGGMSKMLYYVHKTDEAIEKSMVLLKDLKYFDDHQPSDADDVEGLDLLDDFDDDSDSLDGEEAVLDNDEEAVDDDEDFTEYLHLGENILAFWKKRREKLITPLSIAGWFCSPMPDIRKDVVAHETGADRLEVEKVIEKIYHPIGGDDLGIIIQTFWREFDDFQTKRGSYSRSYIWQANEIKEGNCHLWHKLYSFKFTKVLGRVACRVCSKPLGCGQAERNWGALKHLKTGKRSHLSSEKAEKQATIYGSACIEKMRAKEEVKERFGVVTSHCVDADMAALEMGLENWEGNPGSVPAPTVPKRLFKAWIEDWEWECIRNNDEVAEAKLLQKYGGMRWNDPDGDGGGRGMCIAVADNMEFQRGRNGAGWCVIGSNKMDDGLEPWTIDIVIDLIAEYPQPVESNVEILVDDELREANWERQQQQANKRRK